MEVVIVPDPEAGGTLVGQAIADLAMLSPGAAGDLVLLDADGILVATVIGGRVACDQRESASWRS